MLLMFTLLLFQGLNWATAHVDTPATAANATAVPMLNTTRFDTVILLKPIELHANIE
jgi:hypothetical protein